jgi:hypothetical protein
MAPEIRGPGLGINLLPIGWLDAYLRTSNKPFGNIDEVISREELAALTSGYARVAGYERDRSRRPARDNDTARMQLFVSQEEFSQHVIK